MNFSSPLKKMTISIYILTVFACSSTTTSDTEQTLDIRSTISSDFKKAAVYSAMKKVADWQLTRFNQQTYLFEGYDEGAYMSPTDSDSHPQGWVYAAFHVGMSRWSELASSQHDDRYYQWQHDVAKNGKYLFSPRIYNADDYAIGQLYLDLFDKYQDPKLIQPLKSIFEMVMHTPSSISLNYEEVAEISTLTQHKLDDKFGGRKFPIVPCKNRWCWADALFMGPPVWFHLAKVTGDQRYVDFADKEFWATADLLWDKEDHLFFRDSRFFDKREPNGEKVIWARGVGWVAAGLARILENLPTDHPSRDKYEDIFIKMMTRLSYAQQSDGLWRPSVLDPDTKPFKETSGTALMTFAYASGINQGLLSRTTFMPVINKAWKALVGAVQSDGKLGWVQQIGEKPDNVSADDSQIYAVGAYLLTGSEIYKLSEN